MPDNINTVVTPSLSDDGWVFSSIKQADYVMADFLASFYSQSNIFQGKVSSYGWVMAAYNNDPPTLMDKLRSMVTALFSRYFNDVVVEVVDGSEDTNSSLVTVNIFVQFVTADGVTQNLAQVAKINNSKFESIREIITNGS